MPYTLGEISNQGQELVPNAWKTLSIGRTDLIAGAGSYTATVYLTLEAPTGATVQGRFYHYRTDGSRWDGPIVERLTTPGLSFVDFTHTGSISKGETVRFEVTYGPDAVDDTSHALLHTARARGLYWK